MKLKRHLPFLVIIIIALFAFKIFPGEDNPKIVSYIADTQKGNIGFYWKNPSGEPFRSIQAVKTQLERSGKKLKFAMNGGMYKTDNSPLGLFIENGKIITPLNTRNAKGNFYMKPNGVFLITKDNKAGIVETQSIGGYDKIKFATQSGPMLLLNGKMHPAFHENSKNLYIRNGVGILPDGKAVFAISKEPVNFYDFAEFFKNMGCKDALYLDGFVSRMYCAEKNMYQADGDFGVIIAETN